MKQKIKKIAKVILTFPQVLIHRAQGIKGTNDELVTFFRYFPFARIYNDGTLSLRSKGQLIKMAYGDYPMSAGLFSSREYDLGAALCDSGILFVQNGAEKVYGYELNKRTYDLAQKNIKLNGLEEKVEIEYCGVSSKKISNSDVLLGACVPEEDRSAVGQANFKTLKQIVQERGVKNGVLKIDVDGFEYEILRSVDSECLACFDSVFIEYHFGVQDLAEKLKAAGFTIDSKEINKVFVDYHPEEFRNMDIGYIHATRN
jgi:FkbM family methyltransferase